MSFTRPLGYDKVSASLPPAFDLSCDSNHIATVRKKAPYALPIIENEVENPTL